MDKNLEEYKEFLEKERKRNKDHIRILDEIDIKLHEMKEIAQYALNNKLKKEDISRMNSQLLTLKGEITDLEKGLIYTLH